MKLDIMNYLDALEYLREYYKARKALEPQFSYQRWAEELGFQNRSSPRLILNGQRRMTPKSVELFARGLNLQGPEKDYFETLVSYQQLQQNSAKKDLLRAKLLSILKIRHDRVEISDSVEFLSDPRLPVLQTLLSFQDLQRTPENLASFFSVDANILREWLTTLARLGLAMQDEFSGEWIARHNSFKVPDALGLLPLQHYNSQILKQAAESVNLPTKERRFRTLLMALSETDYEDFLTELNSFAVQILSRYNSSEISNRRIYQFATALFPALPGAAKGVDPGI